MLAADQAAAGADEYYADTQRDLKMRQAALEQALAVATAQEHAEAGGSVDPVTWGLNESYDAGRKASRPGTAGGTAASTADSEGGKPGAASRAQLLKRYFDAMSDHPDYTERRKQRMATAKPFSFGQRELTRPKSAATRRVEEETQRRIEREERELRSKFRANPVPPTTFVPKYEMMVEEWCARKEALRLIAERRAEERREAEAPGREFAAAMHAAKPGASKPKTAEEAHAEWRKKHCKPFAARPVPKAVVMPKMREMEVREEDRKARIAARASELLAVSKAPARMARASSAKARSGAADAKAADSAAADAKKPEGEDTAVATADAERRAAETSAKDPHLDRMRKYNQELTFKPDVRPGVPNFEESHARERLSLELRRQNRPPTVGSEFAGLKERTEQAAAAAVEKSKQRAQSAKVRVPRAASPHVAKVLLDMTMDEATAKETRWPYRGSRARVPPSDHERAKQLAGKAKPPLATRAHTLAAESAFRHIVGQHEASARQADDERRRADKQRLANQRMSDVLVELGLDQRPVSQKIEEETRKKREATAAQAREYARQRQAYQEQLDGQIPRFLQPGAAGDKLHKQAAERASGDSKTIELLKKHGLGEKTLRDVMLASHKAQVGDVALDVVAVQDAAPAAESRAAPEPAVVTTAAPETTTAPPAAAAAAAKPSDAHDDYSSDSSFSSSSSSSSSSVSSPRSSPSSSRSTSKAK